MSRKYNTSSSRINNLLCNVSYNCEENSLALSLKSGLPMPLTKRVSPVNNNFVLFYSFASPSTKKEMLPCV
jgi:hypothetical protein